ncbi:hypothetical protein CJU89_6128 [Yarrowia sp. B02]|nr:hypothetical protein CJU89_6128 [Yarrowia sp. B02]
MALDDLRALCDSPTTPESAFKAELQNTCPWFEPETSHRSTWRECAEEFVRRNAPGAKFCPSLKFGERLRAPLVFKKCHELDNMDKERSYTSEHGISMDLTHFDQFEAAEDSHYLSGNLFNHNKLVSLPDFLIIASTYVHTCCGLQVEVRVQFKDSPKDFEKLVAGEEMPQFYYLNNHLFMFEHGETCWGEINSNFWYVSKAHGFVPICELDIPLKSITLYDGLFFSITSKSLYALQGSLDGEVYAIDCVTTENLGITVEDSAREDFWDPFETFLGTPEGLYVLDVSTKEVVKVEDAGDIEIK